MAKKYPPWAPKELCEYHREWVAGSPDLDNDVLRVLEKLVTDSRMEAIWKKLDKLSAKRNIQHYYFDFLIAIQPDGPYGIDRLTISEVRATVEEIEKKSRELCFLVKRIMPYAFVRNAPKIRENLLTSVLTNLGDQSREAANIKRTISRPGENRVKSIYFVRHISAFFQKTFGEALNSVIAELHSILLPDAPGLNTDNVRSILRNSPL